MAGKSLNRTNFADTDNNQAGFSLTTSFTPQVHFTVTDNYSLNQYGEMGLATGDTPLVQPTDVAAYGSAEYNAVVAVNAARAIKLDDGASTNFLKDATSKAMPLRT